MTERMTTTRAEQPVPDRVRRDPVALPDHQDQRGDGQKEEEPRVGQGVEKTFDNAHLVILVIKNLEFGIWNSCPNSSCAHS